MTGILSQLITLAAHGNNFLKNGELLNDFDSSNSTFQYCNRIEFKKYKKSFFSSKLKETIVASSPTEWFRFLNNDGCKLLRLYYKSSKDQSLAKDHKLAGFVGGGGTWLIEAVYDNYSNYWQSHWEVTDQDAPDNKIWAVTYGMSASKQGITNWQIDNQMVKDKLSRTLNEISEFAYKRNLQNWGEQFDNAKKVLESDTPENEYYHKDLIPVSNYSLLAKQILFAAGSAWVFGGMGSWNDLGFETMEDTESYERLSAHLYSNINEAIIAATNSY